MRIRHLRNGYITVISKGLALDTRGMSNVMDRQKKRKTLSKKDRLKQEQAVKQELVRLTDIVRKKYKMIVRDSDRAERYFAAQAKPIVMPLQKSLLEGIKQTVVPKQEIKKEEAEEEEDKLNQTFDMSTQTEPENLVSDYLKKLSSKSPKIDNVYGVRADGRGSYLLGDSKIKFAKTKFSVKDKVFEATPGLLELIFMKIPDKNTITTNDLANYKTILQMTNAHRQSYSEEKNINSNKGKKYTTVISILFPPKQPTAEGSGIFDVNSLVKRLRVLVLSKNAGHTGHDKEIQSILDTLRQYKVIA